MNSFIIHSNEYYPDHTLETSLSYIPLNGHYINGFIAGDGCLYLNLKNKNFCRMVLQITQHIKNRLLLVSIAKYFNSPSRVYPHSSSSLQLTLSGIKIWENNIFNHFIKYSLHGTKKFKLEKLFTIRELISGKKHFIQKSKSRK
jgi:hypothetical protein